MKLLVVGILAVSASSLLGYGVWRMLTTSTADLEVVQASPSPRSSVSPSPTSMATPTPQTSATPTATPTAKPTVKPAATPTATPTPKPTGPVVNLAVPFTAQAPDGVWDPAAEEYCEEASMYMVDRYFDGVRGSLDPVTVRSELQKVAAWEDGRFGYNKDINAAEMAVTLNEYYGLNASLDEVVSEARIRQHLEAGSVIIIPAAGKELQNPYFSNGGPWYHALVIRGVDGDSFITNDPGTKRGSGYRYPISRILQAIHDFTGVKENTGTGRKVMVVVKA